MRLVLVLHPLLGSCCAKICSTLSTNENLPSFGSALATSFLASLTSMNSAMRNDSASLLSLLCPMRTNRIERSGLELRSARSLQIIVLRPLPRPPGSQQLLRMARMAADPPCNGSAVGNRQSIENQNTWNHIISNTPSSYCTVHVSSLLADHREPCSQPQCCSLESCWLSRCAPFACCASLTNTNDCRLAAAEARPSRPVTVTRRITTTKTKTVQLPAKTKTIRIEPTSCGPEPQPPQNRCQHGRCRLFERTGVLLMSLWQFAIVPWFAMGNRCAVSRNARSNAALGTTYSKANASVSLTSSHSHF
jgi:hypothetical protein